MKCLYVLYDAECALCRQCRAFLSQQPAYLPLYFVPLQSLDLENRFPGISALHPEKEMIVISDQREVWQGGSAWIMCLYALREYREWSQRLATPTLLPLAKKIVSTISTNRRRLSKLLPKIVIEKTTPTKPSCACNLP